MKEKVMHGVFFLSAFLAILALFFICYFLFSAGIPGINQVGFTQFLFGHTWKPLNQLFGILPMIVGSLYVTALSLFFGVPLGVLGAIFMAFFCPKKIYPFLKSTVELMAGIPSIVYGFFGLVVLVPLIQKISASSGKGVLTAALLLALMILPTIMTVSESALRSVPTSYCEGSLALGASFERSIFTVVLPAARSGIFAGIILGLGRSIGETMAVIMVAGNQAIFPTGLFSGVRTLTANIVLEMGYAADLHREMLIATGVVLFVFILIINLSFSLIKERSEKNGFS